MASSQIVVIVQNMNIQRHSFEDTKCIRTSAADSPLGMKYLGLHQFLEPKKHHR